MIPGSAVQVSHVASNAVAPIKSQVGVHFIRINASLLLLAHYIVPSVCENDGVQVHISVQEAEWASILTLEVCPNANTVYLR